jgi:predicted DNA-binding antitoxin AbrB/MazE fold protein
LDGTYDETWHGVRLVLKYHSEASAFVGTMVNVTEEALSEVRIEIHLSNGVELGPTKPVDLAPGEKIEIELAAEGQDFDWWKAHPETGESKH